MTWMRRSAAALAVLLTVVLLAGCSLMDVLAPGAKEKKPGAGEVAEGPLPAPPAPKVVSARSLFPEGNVQLLFNVTDRGQEPYTVKEDLVQESGRIVAAYNGDPYLAWVLNDAGIWRVDPKGGGALLRYLPPIMKDGEAWKQTSGGADVWFRLQKGEGRCVIPGAPAPEDCWELTVLNRGEATVFRFATGLGPVEAIAENYPNPPLSFTKKAAEAHPGAVGDEARTSYLSRQFAAGAESAVTPVTGAEFDAAFKEMQGSGS